MWVPADAYLSLPLNISSATDTPYTANTPIAIKQSSLSLVNGIIIADESTTIVADTNGLQMNLINNVKLVTDYDNDWYTSYASELDFVLDKTPAINNNFMVSSATGAGIIPPNELLPYYPSGAGLPSVNYNPSSGYNEGFQIRSQWFKNRFYFNSVSNTFQGTYNIPLKYIHSYFANMNFPVKNIRYKIAFFLSFLSSQNFCPFEVPAGTPLPLVTIGTNASASNSGLMSYNQTRLYYRAITLNAQQNKHYASFVERGLTKKLYYTQTLGVGNLNGSLYSATALPNTILTSAITAPWKIWMLVCPAGSLFNTNAGAATMTPPVFTGQLTNMNIAVNNQNFYQQNFQFDWEFWEELKKTLPKQGALIDYQDFITNYQYYCFDVSKIQQQLRDPFSACQLAISSGTLVNPNSSSWDINILIESVNCCQHTFSTGRVTSVVRLD